MRSFEEVILLTTSLLLLIPLLCDFVQPTLANETIMFLRRFVPLLVLLTSAAAAGPSSRLPVASTNKVVTAPAFVAKDTPSSLASSVVTMPRGVSI